MGSKNSRFDESKIGSDLQVLYLKEREQFGEHTSCMYRVIIEKLQGKAFAIIKSCLKANSHCSVWSCQDMFRFLSLFILFGKWFLYSGSADFKKAAANADLLTFIAMGRIYENTEMCQTESKSQQVKYFSPVCSSGDQHRIWQFRYYQVDIVGCIGQHEKPK